jgi:DNA polymerase epsilon subunit 1
MRQNARLVQQKYIINVVGELRKVGCNVISVSKEIMIIEGMSLDYIRECMGRVDGYELMVIREVRRYDKMVYIDPCNYFFMRDDKISCMSDVKIPLKFLDMFFRDSVSDEYVYSVCKQYIGFLGNGEETPIKLMLDILECRRDVGVLRENCNSLGVMKSGLDGQAQGRTLHIPLDIFCGICGTENVLRSRCVKCYNKYDTREVDEVYMKYIYDISRKEIHGESMCNRCNKVKERRIRKYCNCGGEYHKKGYKNRLSEIHVRTKRMEEYLDHFLSYFIE